MRAAWEAALSMNDYKTIVPVFLVEVLAFLQGRSLNGDAFAIEVYRCLAEVFFQNGDMWNSIKISTDILTISQVRFYKF